MHQVQHALFVTILALGATNFIGSMQCLDQIIPQAICSRYGLYVGANFVWLVRILMIICYPIAYPIGKVNSPLLKKKKEKKLLYIACSW